jgi:DNA-binding transcriptional LysR family regulator
LRGKRGSATRARLIAAADPPLDFALKQEGWHLLQIEALICFGHNLVDHISAKPRIAVECDSASSLITEVEAGGIALLTTVFKLVAGKRLRHRPLTGTTEAGSVGIARATKGDVTPVGENFSKSCCKQPSKN